MEIRGIYDLLYEGKQNEAGKHSQSVDWQQKCLWYSLAYLDNRNTENVQNIGLSHKLHHRGHEKVESGINSMRKTLVKVKIQRSIFQGNALLPLLFVIAMIPLTYILRKCAGVMNLQNQKKILIILCTWMTSSYLSEMKKNWRPWYR